MNKQIGSLPAGVDLLLYAGDDFWLRLSVAEPDGTPVDLTGVVASAQIRTSPGDAGQLLAEFDITIADDGSHMTLELSSADTAALPATASWDVQIVDTDGLTSTLAYGRVKNTAQVTQP